MKKIAIILADGFEEVEAVATINLLRRATIKVDILGVEHIRTTGARGITIECDEIFNYYSCLEYDGVVFVGGMQNAKTLSENSQVIELIDYYYDNKKMIAGICATPALVFSKSSLPDNLECTCYPDEELKSAMSRFNYVDKNVVVSENVITSQSPFTSFEFALNIVDYLGCNAEALLGRLQGK